MWQLRKIANAGSFAIVVGVCGCLQNEILVGNDLVTFDAEHNEISIRTTTYRAQARDDGAILIGSLTATDAECTRFALADGNAIETTTCDTGQVHPLIPVPVGRFQARWNGALQKLEVLDVQENITLETSDELNANYSSLVFFDRQGSPAVIASSKAGATYALVMLDGTVIAESEPLADAGHLTHIFITDDRGFVVLEMVDADSLDLPVIEAFSFTDRGAPTERVYAWEIATGAIRAVVP